MSTPIPPWEQEQAAEALAELQRESELERKEREALEATKGSQLVDEVDRMIAERKAELERMATGKSPLSASGGALQLPSARLLSNPTCLLIMIALITLMVIGLMFAGSWVARHMSQLPVPGEVESREADPLGTSSPESTPTRKAPSEETPNDGSTEDQSQSGVYP